MIKKNTQLQPILIKFIEWWNMFLESCEYFDWLHLPIGETNPDFTLPSSEILLCNWIHSAFDSDWFDSMFRPIFDGNRLKYHGRNFTGCDTSTFQ